MGKWALPNAEIAYTKDGEDINLKQLTVELAANPKVHVVQWAESSLGCPALQQKPDRYQADPFALQQGVQRWLSLHRASNTEQFINYYKSAMPTMKTLCWPDDLVTAGFRPFYDEQNEVIEHYVMELQQPSKPDPYMVGSQTMPARHRPTDVLVGVGGPKPVGIRKPTP